MTAAGIAYGLSNKRALILILAIGLLLRLSALAFFWDTPLTIVDETHYQAIAENIVNNHEFAVTTGHPTSIRPPLYPAFLSLVYLLINDININAVRIVQIALSLGIISMVYLLGKKLFNAESGLSAAFIFAIYPSFLFFTSFILTEILFTFLLTLFIWFFLEAQNQGTPLKSRNFFLAGFFLGLCALTRSILYPFLPFALIFLALVNKGTFRQKGKWLLLFIAGYVLVVFPWAMRNTLLQKSPVIVGTMGGLNMYMGNYEHTPLNRAWAAIDLTGEKTWYYGHENVLKNMNEAQKQKWAVSKAKEFILDHKLLTIKRSLIKAANFWGIERSVTGGIINGHWPELNKTSILIMTTLLIFIVYSFVVIGAVYGIIYNIGRYNILFILILFAYFTAMHSIVFGHARYHLPLVSLMVIFASWSLLNLRKIIEERKKWPFKISFLFSLLFISIWAREIIFIEGARFFKGIFQ